MRIPTVCALGLSATLFACGGDDEASTYAGPAGGGAGAGGSVAAAGASRGGLPGIVTSGTGAVGMGAVGTGAGGAGGAGLGGAPGGNGGTSTSNGGGPVVDPALPSSGDPGVGPWDLVARENVANECHLDPDLLDTVVFSEPWLIVRYGKMCWAASGALSDAPAQNFSTTKTLGALTLGVLSYETRDIPRTGRQTGPVSDEDRIDHWLDPTEFTYNSEAHIAHVLAMQAHSASLAFGDKRQSYDTIGSVQINTLITVMNRAIGQDPTRLGGDLAGFSRDYVFGPLGMTTSSWDTNDLSGLTGWSSAIGDMARLGLLMLHRGMWDGRQLLSPDWIYRMTHPSFEDGNTAYGYLTWLNARANWHLADLEIYALGRFTDNTQPLVPCAPSAINTQFPHGLSEAPDCLYAPHADCEQQYDVGAWQANGLGGQLIVGMPALDLLIVTRNFGTATGEGLLTMGEQLWNAIIPAVVAYDPVYPGDVAAFCAAYAAGSHAPDLH